MSGTHGGDSAASQAAAKKRAAAAAKAARQRTGQRGKPGQSATALGKEAKAWQAGAVGEERAARQLARLRGEATVLNDRLLDPAKAWNLDHLVVSPAGVYFIDAKNWRGDLTVRNGQLWRHWNAGPVSGRKHEKMDREVNKVAAMAEHATRRLGHRVVPVIALAGTRSRQFDGVQFVGNPAAPVIVLSIDTLAAWLRELAATRPTIRAVEVKPLGELAARTFPPATLPPENTWQSRMASRD